MGHINNKEYETLNDLFLRSYWEGAIVVDERSTGIFLYEGMNHRFLWWTTKDLTKDPSERWIVCRKSSYIPADKLGGEGVYPTCIDCLTIDGDIHAIGWKYES